MFADSAFYQEQFLEGRAPLIPLEEFAHWAKRATALMNWRRVELVPVPPPVALCCCALAEQLYKEREGVILSERAGQWAVTYQRQTQCLLRQYLGGGPYHNLFVYEGVGG